MPFCLIASYPACGRSPSNLTFSRVRQAAAKGKGKAKAKGKGKGKGGGGGGGADDEDDLDAIMAALEGGGAAAKPKSAVSQNEEVARQRDRLPCLLSRGFGKQLSTIRYMVGSMISTTVTDRSMKSPYWIQQPTRHDPRSAMDGVS